MAALSLVGAACGGDGGNGSGNETPTAAFTFQCTLLVCNFTDGSTDPDGAADITSWRWDFGGDGTSDVQSPAHTFSAAGTYQVTLTVTDAAGATNTSAPVAVTVSTTPPANQPPTAGFTVDCSSLDCTFTNTSADVDGTFTSSWNFGEPASGANNTSTETNPSHTYAVTAVTDFTVTLTVTDDDGAAATATQSIRVSPAAGLECNGVDCTLDLDSKSTVTITVTAANCQFTGNAFTILAPITETVFSDGCSLTPGTVFQINGGAAFNAGTQLQAQFTQGSGDATDPPKGSAATQVSGVFPDWEIRFDDGGQPTAPREPDFNDIVLAVHATAVP